VTESTRYLGCAVGVGLLIVALAVSSPATVASADGAGRAARTAVAGTPVRLERSGEGVRFPDRSRFRRDVVKRPTVGEAAGGESDPELRTVFLSIGSAGDPGALQRIEIRLPAKAEHAQLTRAGEGRRESLVIEAQPLARKGGVAFADLPPCADGTAALAYVEYPVRAKKEDEALRSARLQVVARVGGSVCRRDAAVVPNLAHAMRRMRRARP